MTPTSTAAVLGAMILAIYLLYRILLPRPIPNIPFNPSAIQSLLGDIPSMTSHVRHTSQVFSWLTLQTTILSSPIIQVFATPFGRPWVVITDPWESQDILLRRSKEFDRSRFFGDIIGGILPEQHISYKSDDERFRGNRGLINHLMSWRFIEGVSGVQVYSATLNLINLWSTKCALASQHPFDAHADITYAALDTIFATLFSTDGEEGCMEGRLLSVKSFQPPPPSSTTAEKDQYTPIVFPSTHTTPPIYRAALTLADSVKYTQTSPVPRLTSWVLRQMPSMRRAERIKDGYIRRKTDEALSLMSTSAEQDESPQTALHSVLLRERALALAQARQPAYYRRGISDEFFGLLLAGHDTSATTLAWGVKFLADHVPVQHELRGRLGRAIPDAVAENRLPKYEELLGVIRGSRSVAYLDAVAEEILRHANTVAFVVREAVRDVTVLGRWVPRGTDVFMMGNGPGFLGPSFTVPDKERSAGARMGSGKPLTGLWDDKDASLFRPERWLKTDEKGEEVYDSMAGPTLAFGLGPRGCFGKRLARVALKMQVALLLWRFDLLEVGGELGGYEGVQSFAREPRRCFVRLKVMDGEAGGLKV